MLNERFFLSLQRSGEKSRSVLQQHRFQTPRIRDPLAMGPSAGRQATIVEYRAIENHKLLS